MARTYGSYMLQPTKDQLRANNSQLRRERDSARAKVEDLTRQLKEAEERLTEAYRLIGRQKVDASLAKRKVAS